MAMQSRKDLLHAHRLMTQRAALALLRGEPDVPDQPLRRLNVGTFAGILVGVIAAGIFGIWGLLFHGSPSLSKEPSVIIDKQTGATYIWCEHNQAICPEVNYASALLALQSSTAPPVQSVNQSELTGIPHGSLLGIAGLPPDLPTPGLLIKQPWSVCTLSQFGHVGGVKTTTAVAGGFQSGGQPIGSSLLLVVDNASGQDWVIGNGLRMPINHQTMTDLWPSTQPVSVPSVWLNAVPQGDFFQAPPIADQGSLVTGPTGAKVQVGTLYQNGASPPQYYVLLDSGSLAPIDQTQESLLALDRGNLPPNTSTPPTLNPSQLTNIAPQPSTDGLPTTDKIAVATQSNTELCAVYSGTGPALEMQVETGGQMPTGGMSTGAQPGSGLVDQVALEGGEGALVKESSVSYILVTDGHRYALANTSVPSFLGYNTSQAVQLPANIVDLIPVGPGFDPAQANEPVQSGG